jgi:hypothetical protein
MSLKITMQNFNQKISRRIPNWARLFFPLILGSLLILIVVKIMYFGGKRESLAAQSESAIIRWALAYAAEPTLSANKVVTISVTDDDLPALERAPHPQLIDAHIREYAAVLEQVAASQPDWIVVSWLTYAHPITQEYLQPLTDVIDRLQLRSKTTLAVNLYASGTIAPEFMSAYNIVEARDCYYEINAFCTVAPDWSWMPQQIINRYFKTEPRWHVSKNLPHTLPNVLLNLPTANSMTKHPFLDFRPPVMAELQQGSVVFIGNDTTQSLHFRDNKDALQRTFTASSSPRRTLLKDGIPWHLFWASMTSMFIDGKTIAVVPEWVDWASIVLITAAILLSIRSLGGAALAPFFVCAISLPFANMIGVYFFAVYMPVIPIVIAGLIVFTAATFTTVAYSSYKKWRLQAAEDLAESTADIKENFIHLISHNLNTPIAQLRGLLEILAPSNSQDTGIQRASELLEYVRITVQCVLNTSTMAIQELNPVEHPIRAFMHEFMENDTGFFRRTGTNLFITPSEDNEEKGEIWFYRFRFDRTLVTSSILYAAVLIGLRHRASSIELNIAPLNDEPADPQGLAVTLTPVSVHESSQIKDTDFAIKALERFLSTMQARGILLIPQSETNGFKIVFPDEGKSAAVSNNTSTT